MTAPEGRPKPQGTAAVGEEIAPGKLLPAKSALDFQSRWENIQHAFVDEPRDSITKADALVSEVMEQLARTFNEQRHALENQWSTGEPSTEELRTAFQRYRLFFDRLLNV